MKCHLPLLSSGLVYHSNVFAILLYLNKYHPNATSSNSLIFICIYKLCSQIYKFCIFLMDSQPCKNNALNYTNVIYCHLSTWNCALNRLVCHLAVIFSVSFLVGFPATVTNSITTLPFLASFIRAIGSPLNCVGSKPCPGGAVLRGSLSSYRSSSSMSSSLSCRKWEYQMSSSV